MRSFIEENQASWDARAAAHAASPDYARERFLADAGFLSGVVCFDLPRLGELSGLDGVHLQCHIGTDTISLARLGARMTGLDFSAASLDEARELAAASRSAVSFVKSDVRDALAVLPKGAFDLVYTGVGALCWLPEIRPWAAVVAALLRPGGRLFLRDGHPMLWALADTTTAEDPITLEHPYFEAPEQPVMDESSDTYVAVPPGASIAVSRSYSWNHGLGELVSSLLAEGLSVTGFEEHDSVPWNALPGHMVQDEFGEWRLADRPERLAASYTLQAVRVS